MIPPHFTVTSDNPLMQEGFDFCFGNIIEVETERTSDGNSFVEALISSCLSYLIFHSYELLTMMSSRPSHPFSNIPIFQNP